MDDLLKTASQKFGISAKKIFTPQGGEIDDIKLIRDDDVLYVTKENEDFIKLEENKGNYALNTVLRDPVKNDCDCFKQKSNTYDSNKYGTNVLTAFNSNIGKLLLICIHVAQS